MLEEDIYGTICQYKREYDKNDNLILIQSEYRGLSEPIFSSMKLKYDENNNVIYKEDNDEKWEKLSYNDSNNIIYKEDNDGEWNKFTYDNRERLTKKEYSNGTQEEWQHTESSVIYINFDNKEKYTITEE
jgi:YD repeat-containing protein